MRQTEREYLIKPKFLMTDLGFMQNITQPQLEDILDGQYRFVPKKTQVDLR